MSISTLAFGEPGKPWGLAEKKEWRDTRIKSRSYFEDIVRRVEDLKKNERYASAFVVTTYGYLPHNTDDDDDEASSSSSSGESSSSFPLFAIRTREWSRDKPCVLVTGGVHGYETSGVEGAFLFLECNKAEEYSKYFNILVCPCISPWGYERIQRWNAKAVDPNRSFNPEGKIVPGRPFNPEAATEESAAIIEFLRTEIEANLMGIRSDDDDDDNDDNKGERWICHIDLHETTDTDVTEFIPAMAARAGKIPDVKKHGKIPDGFYLVQDSTSPQPEWFTAMIDRVRTVTHIAPPNENGKIIGFKISQEGVIGIPCNKSLGLCAGVTRAPYRATTEVYPDSVHATPEQCNRAQVVCVEAGLDYILEHELGVAQRRPAAAAAAAVDNNAAAAAVEQ